MFAIAFDITIADLRRAYPKHPRGAYLEIEKTLGRFGFRRIQESVFAAETDDLAELFEAINALKAIEWFVESVKSLRAFRIENGSDFTASIKRRT